MFKYAITGVLLLTYFASDANARKCYTCFGVGNNSSCEVDYKSQSVEDCNANVFSRIEHHIKDIFFSPEEISRANNWKCMIMQTKHNGYTSSFIRSCVPALNGVCDQSGESNGVRKTCCDYDLCNSSNKMNIGLFNLSICFIVSLFVSQQLFK